MLTTPLASQRIHFPFLFKDAQNFVWLLQSKTTLWGSTETKSKRRGGGEVEDKNL